jgi:hypothetical protein
MPARIPRRRNPSRIAFASYAASAYITFGRVRARPLPLFFTRKPPSTSSQPTTIVRIPRSHHHTQRKPIFIHPNARFRPFSLLMPIDSYTFPPFFASTSVESTATASTFPFPSVYPQSRRACRIWCQTPFSWSSRNRRQAV